MTLPIWHTSILSVYIVNIYWRYCQSVPYHIVNIDIYYCQSDTLQYCQYASRLSIAMPIGEWSGTQCQYWQYVQILTILSICTWHSSEAYWCYNHAKVYIYFVPCTSCSYGFGFFCWQYWQYWQYWQQNMTILSIWSIYIVNICWQYVWTILTIYTTNVTILSIWSTYIANAILSMLLTRRSQYG